MFAIILSSPASMKKFTFLVVFLCVSTAFTASAQNTADTGSATALHKLIDQYSEAREAKDTVLLKSILTDEVDQLVSSGEWRTGIRSAIEGMLRSSDANPGSRTLTVDRVRFLTAQSALVDCRYEIKGANGSIRKMWSSFIAVKQEGTWKIAAIRNMLPAGAN